MFEDDRIGQRGLKGFWAALGLAALLGGCASMNQQQPQQQPQPDTAATAIPASDAASADASSAQQQAASASVTRVVTKTTYVRVRRGDTLQRIAQKHSVSVRDLAAWNHLKPNGHLRAGQSIKLVSKQTITVQVAAPPAGGATANSTASAAANTAGSRQVAAEMARHANSVALVWPAHGRVVEPFAPGATRGIEIAGKAGDPVIAAADGKVMYAGTGLNEYGSLIIVQHNKDFLTAYSHNRRLLVKTGDMVHQGQQIAEMGSENNDRVAVLFEVRRDGKPVDPMPYLPSPPQG
ncbi:peptidoglycan DD-metalloendopeptidase family protein [Paraburkholderia silvatlantica]|uniref:Lipoprotein NlpD n=1 Tax=Paraburkholderia silvatlantica TaxID=321895 RepID=A0A2U1ABG1_9BURK|nr:peptidoglycan DD-metalloendopeptidase family protein [Paraburkholderia silvatlantica]MBB2930288.1 lipoprotein NlpD [Paraburkholderia silvatlantica]PVY32117.1 murein DD-endopeptidase MepM/ murein hydrolase activator NlpD [Paraburkholderia silvatlantica]PXW37737.1 murein DD-endopeptidase MepM/ murein hydrolase activator NlpD [Paraburkholderia silvatlantica]PYE25558.1 murein DD-endopeptidase MepM/ murein hydrolase activator NlpD [Paraburkholderia silvatlantica]TDQ97799.1 murein DD-endopeptidas